MKRNLNNSAGTHLQKHARPTRILLVDDHTLVRQSLSEVLNRVPEFEIVGSVQDAQQAVTLAPQVSPDVILMDIDMPGMICFDAAKRIRAMLPEVRLLFLSAFVHDRYIEQALQVGASGYLSKHEPQEQLIIAIQSAMNNASYFSPQVWERLVVDQNGVRINSESASRTSTLTLREIEVLRYLANGLSRKEIAAVMHLSLKTVEVHATNMMNKLDIHNRVELTHFALREGFINL